MKQSKSKWFRLYADCIVVKGKNGNLLYDLGSSNFYDLSDSCVNLLEISKSNSFDQLLKEYDWKFEELNKFFEYFIENNLGFYTHNPESFPDMNLEWDSPYLIINSIIEINEKLPYKFESLVKRLSELSCQAIQIRFLRNVPLKVIKDEILVYLEDTRINFVEIIYPFDECLSEENYFELISYQPRLQRILVYNSPCDIEVKSEIKLFKKKLLYFKKDIRLDNSEIITVGRFFTNIKMFTEAKYFNLGLNRKVCIDQFGFVKNYLNHEKKYGNICSDDIGYIINNCEFQSKWFLSNDVIEICKDCCFRYTCVSNSDLLLIEGKYHKKNMCNIYKN